MGQNASQKTHIRTPAEDAMMASVTAGIDVGNSTTKAVVLYDGQISHAIVPTVDEAEIVASLALQQALDSANLFLNDLQCIFGSGVGGKGLEMARGNYLSAISCAVK